MEDYLKEEKRRQYLEMIDNNIKNHGFHVTYVLEEINITPFGYSTGLYKNFGIPEVFVSGLPNGLTNTLITNYAKAFRNKQVLLYEKLDNLIDRFSVYIIPVDSTVLDEKVLASYTLYNGSNFESVQIIYPDLNGYFPEEENYNYDMEIFGSLNRNY